MIVRHQLGAGLIEVAVALLVLSLGTLGLARGQLTARQGAVEALYRSEAVLLGAALMEHLRGHPAAFLALGSSDIGAMALPDADCSEQSCSAQQWGAWSLWRWRQDLRGSVATDEKAKAVAGLIAPHACLWVGAELAVLELSWQAAPEESSRSCMAGSAGAGVGVLSLQARLEVPGS